MTKETPTFIFIGRSGCGKGTQIDLLKEYLTSKNMPFGSIVMGDIFRSFFKEPGYVKDIARDVSMNQGKFQPDFLTNALFVRKTIDIADENSVLLFDGYPRTINQLGIIKELLVYIKRENNVVVVNIEVSRENVKARMLSRGRADDSHGPIESRLNEYDKLIVPMIEVAKSDTFFKYLEVNGEGSMQEVHTEIINSIKEYL
jgi:adenylate kinase family enzyme